MTSRQNRRAALQAAIKTVSQSGLRPGGHPVALAAATRLILDILTGKARDRASAAARRAAELFDLSLERQPREPAPACRKGCHFCCHAWVSATPPEIFLVANTLRDRHRTDLATLIERLGAATADTRGLDQTARHATRQACALLVDGLCSVYQARPINCRAFASLSLEKCEETFRLGGEDIPVPAINMALRTACNQALWGAIAYAGLSFRTYDLVQGVLVVLTTPDAEPRWLAGEDVFASLEIDETSRMSDSPEARTRFESLGAMAMGREPGR